jgi:hypothetical protein
MQSRPLLCVLKWRKLWRYLAFLTAMQASQKRLLLQRRFQTLRRLPVTCTRPVTLQPRLLHQHTAPAALL